MSLFEHKGYLIFPQEKQFNYFVYYGLIYYCFQNNQKRFETSLCFNVNCLLEATAPRGA